jgi:hypothetical protein
MPSGVYTRTDETRDKIRALKLGKKRKPFTEEALLNMSLAKRGKKFSNEHKAKLSVALSGSKNPMYGRCGDLNPARRSDVRKKISQSKLGKARLDIRGANHPRWKGGVGSLNERMRKSLEYVIWRRAVFTRDGFTCIWCGDNRGGNLEADHIKPFALYPELRFAIDNGRTLCKTCHKSTDTWGGKTR